MKKIYILTLSIIFSFVSISGQLVTDFNEFEVGENSFINDSGEEGEFCTENICFSNFYDAQFDFWTGFSISNVNDSTTPGFGNQYAAITGSSFEADGNYSVAYAFDPISLHLTESSSKNPMGFYITNSTYGYLAMQDGNAVGKKFGGEDGNDPDFFLLTIHFYSGGEKLADSLDIYLADYRFEDNSQDYLLKDWQWVDLSAWTNIDSMYFSMNSSDIGQWGMNNPTYFCMDQFTMQEVVDIEPLASIDELKVFPNPLLETLNVFNSSKTQQEFQLINLQGQLIQSNILQTGNNQINVSELQPGVYLGKTQAGESTRLIKL